MNEPVSSDASDTPEAPMTPRFCRGCGAAWDVAWTDCPNCTHMLSQRASRAPEVIQPRALRSSLWLYFVLLATFVPLMLADEDRPDVQIIIAILDATIVLGWVVASWRHVGASLRPPPRLLWLPVGAVAGVGTFAVATTVVSLLGAMGVPQFDYATLFLDAGYGWATIVLLIVVQPALIEELAFRGVILQALRSVMTSKEAIIVSAMMFMSLHLSPAMFPHTAVMGLVAGWLRVRTGSVYPCVLMHAMHNGLVIAIEYAQITGAGE